MDEIEFQKAMIFGAHPDDAEFLCGGSTAKWSAAGKEIVVCIVTNGAMGSNDPSFKRDDLIAARRSEAKAAASITGASDVIFLGYEDGYVEDNHDLRRDMIREIRRFKPDVVIGPDPSRFYMMDRYVNHPDHRAVGKSFLAAVNPGATTVPLYREELYDKGFEPHKIKACLLYGTTEPDYFVEVSDVVDTKIKSLMAHTSQTPEFSDLEKFVPQWGEMVAGLAGGGFKQAEGFKAMRFERDEEN